MSLKGDATAEGLAEVFCVAPFALQPILSAFEHIGFLKALASGYKLTLKGRHAAHVLWRQEAAAADIQELRALKQSVAAPDGALKPIFSDWLMAKGKDGPVRNTHLDPAYDDALIGRLQALHPQMDEAVKTLLAQVPRCEIYRGRLARAADLLKRGDHRYMTNPDVDSYQAIWLELGADLGQLLQ